MLFHKHKFIKDGLNLWCECGKIKTLKCSHKWKLHSEQRLRTEQKMTGTHQDILIHTLICENCGEIKKIDVNSANEEKEIL